MTPHAILPDALVAALSRAAHHGVVTIAYSGGLDSRFLALAAKTLGWRVRLLHLRGIHVAPQESADALRAADALGLSVEVITMAPDDYPDLAAAGRQRCYVCKRRLFERLLAAADGAPLCDGTQASDLTVYRPGRRALQELGIRSPLAEAGLTKNDIRTLGRAIGLPDPDQAAKPCLLTRFPYGMRPSAAQLKLTANIEAAVAADPRFAALRCRLRHPDGLTPELHVEAASAEALSDEALNTLCEALRRAYAPTLMRIPFRRFETLSGYFDRQEEPLSGVRQEEPLSGV